MLTEMEWTIAAGPSPPLSHKLALLLTLLFVFIGVPAARRSRYPLLVLALPVLWNLVAAFLGLANGARAQSFSGGGTRAAAAGVAEAHLPLEWGLFEISCLSLLYAWRAPVAAGAPANASRRGTVALITVAVMLLAADYWVSSQLLGSSAIYAEWKITAGLTLAVIAGAVLLVCSVAAVLGRGAPAIHHSRSGACMLAAVSLAAALVVRNLLANLREYAMSP